MAGETSDKCGLATRGLPARAVAVDVLMYTVVVSLLSFSSLSSLASSPVDVCLVVPFAVVVVASSVDRRSRFRYVMPGMLLVLLLLRPLDIVGKPH